jgi:hypothetical protein
MRNPERRFRPADLLLELVVLEAGNDLARSDFISAVDSDFHDPSAELRRNLDTLFRPERANQRHALPYGRHLRDGRFHALGAGTGTPLGAHLGSGARPSELLVETENQQPTYTERNNQ